MKNDDPEADDAAPMKATETQVIDLNDLDLSVVPTESSPSLPEPSSVRSSRVPPPLPPEVLASHAPPPGAAPSPTEAPARGLLFYGGILMGVFVASIAIGLIVVRSRHAAQEAQATPSSAAASPSATSAAPAPNVINLSPVDMNDEPDGAP